MSLFGAEQVYTCLEKVFMVYTGLPPDVNQHLEQDELPVTKDVNQRVVLSRLTADVFQRVENQGFRSNLMSSDVLSSVSMDIQDQWPGGPGQADFEHQAICMNGCGDVALCMMGVKRSVGQRPY